MDSSSLHRKKKVTFVDEAETDGARNGGEKKLNSGMVYV